MLYVFILIYFYHNFKEYNKDIPDDSKVMECANGQSYENDLRGGKSCKFDHKDLFKSSGCTEDKQYGYDTPNPCVLIKLNKMIDFVPTDANGTKVIQIKCHPDVNIDTVNKDSFLKNHNLGRPLFF